MRPQRPDEKEAVVSGTSTPESLMSRYCHAIDDRDLLAWGDLFAADAELVCPGLGVIRGRENIRAYGDGMLAVLDQFGIGGRHVGVNPIVEQRESTATAISDFTFLSVAEGVWNVVGTGRYLDEMTLNGTWEFTSRTITWYRNEVPESLVAALSPLFAKLGEPA